MGHKWKGKVVCVFCKKDLSAQKGNLKVLIKDGKEVYSCPHHKTG